MALAAMNLVHFDRFVGVCNRYASEGRPITFLPKIKIIIMNMLATSNGDFLLMARRLAHVLPTIQLD